MSWGDYYPRKPSVASQRAAAREMAAALKKKDKAVEPVVIEGRTIVQTFWGKAWCTNLEAYHDFANRLPRGRSYVLNEAVVDLRIEAGAIQARLMGTELYHIDITIDPLPAKAWSKFKKDTAGQISSAIALLKGELPGDVLKRIVDLESGLFPSPKEITMYCDCPDSARMCKHIAASMYGVGHRLDTQPALLFKLRGVDSAELLQQAISVGSGGKSGSTKPKVSDKHLEDIFGVKIVKKTAAIDKLLENSRPAKTKNAVQAGEKSPPKKVVRKTKKKAAKKKAAKKKVAKKKAKARKKKGG